MIDLPLERFESHIAYEALTGCWLWTAGRSKSGYGKFKAAGLHLRAHRVAWAFKHGYMPPRSTTMVLDHLCRNRACVNPDHLELVTCRENLLRGEGETAALSRTGMCRNGHTFSGKYANGRNYCHKCRNARVRDYRARKRAMNSIHTIGHVTVSKETENTYGIF